MLGALAALREWHFFNIGTKEKPEPATAPSEEVEGRYLLVFSDTDRIEEMLEGRIAKDDLLPVITIPTALAMDFCLGLKADGCAGLLLNPGEDAALIPLVQLESFYAEWKQRGGRQASGFWIPGMTTGGGGFLAGEGGLRGSFLTGLTRFTGLGQRQGRVLDRINMIGIGKAGGIPMEGGKENGCAK